MTPHIAGQVEIVEKLGAESVLYCQTDASAEPLVMRVPPKLPLVPDDTVYLRFDLEHMHLFDANGVALPPPAR